MHRKVIQTFLSTAFRPGVNVYTTPRLHFHLMKHVLFSKSPSLTPATEEITDFSDLSSEEFGTLHPNRRNTRQKMEQLPEEEDERIEFDLTNEEGRKNRRPKEYYEKLIEKFLAEKRVWFRSVSTLLLFHVSSNYQSVYMFRWLKPWMSWRQEF